VERRSEVSDVGKWGGSRAPMGAPRIDARCDREDSAQMAVRVCNVFVKSAKADTGSDEGGIVAH